MLWECRKLMQRFLPSSPTACAVALVPPLLIVLVALTFGDVPAVAVASAVVAVAVVDVAVAVVLVAVVAVAVAVVVEGNTVSLDFL